MSRMDKMKNKASELAGAGKERLGGATGNEQTQAEGATQRAQARARQAGEHVKEAGRDVRGTFRQ